MKERAKHPRFLSLLILQCSLLIMTPTLFLVVGFSNNQTNTTKIAVICVSSILIIIQVFFLLFSLLTGYHGPIIIEQDGISIKQNGRYVRHEWKDVVFVKTIRRGYYRSFKGLLTRVIIGFSNGQTIKFEPDDIFEKKLFRICRDKEFIEKYKKAREY